MDCTSPLILDDRPVAAIFRSPIFNRSETFIQTHAASLQRYQALIVGLGLKGNIAPALRSRILPMGTGAERLRFQLLGDGAALAARLRPLAPALLHAHFGPDGLLALDVAQRLRIPLVTTLHGYEIGRSRSRLLLSGRLSWTRYALFRNKLMRGGALFLAVSEALRRRALEQGYPAERTVTHIPGINLDRFEKPEKEAEQGLILHVGRLVEKKGTALLLDAFASVREQWPEAKLAIIGDGPLRSSLEARARQLGIAGSVRFLGELSPGEVAQWMARAWLLAAPSVTARDGDSEGLPTILCEAAASSLPAVTSDHSGNGEAVADGRSGFVVPEGRAEPLVWRMLDLLRAPRLRNAMAVAARGLAEERFDARRQNGLLEDHYDRLSFPAGKGAGCA